MGSTMFGTILILLLILVGVFVARWLMNTAIVKIEDVVDNQFADKENAKRNAQGEQLLIERYIAAKIKKPCSHCMKLLDYKEIVCPYCGSNIGGEFDIATAQLSNPHAEDTEELITYESNMDQFVYDLEDETQTEATTTSETEVTDETATQEGIVIPSDSVGINDIPGTADSRGASAQPIAVSKSDGMNKKKFGALVAIAIILAVGITALIIVQLNKDGGADDQIEYTQEDTGYEEGGYDENIDETADETTDETTDGSDSGKYNFTGVDPENTADYELVKDKSNYVRHDSDSFSFLYPAGFYNNVYTGDNDDLETYLFESDDPDSLLSYSAEDNYDDPQTVVRKLKREAANGLYEVNWSYPDADDISSVKESKNGGWHGIVTGYTTEEKNAGAYYYICADDNKVYTMTINNPVQEPIGGVAPADYLIDCLYRGFSPSNTTEPIRSFKEFVKSGNN